MRPYFPQTHGPPRVDDRLVTSGIIFVLKSVHRWRDAPSEYGPHNTLHDRFVRWNRLDVFGRIFSGLSAEEGEQDTLMIDAIRLKADRTACGLLKRRCTPSYRAHGRRPKL